MLTRIPGPEFDCSDAAGPPPGSWCVCMYVCMCVCVCVCRAPFCPSLYALHVDGCMGGTGEVGHACGDNTLYQKLCGGKFLVTVPGCGCLAIYMSLVLLIYVQLHIDLR